MKRPIILAIFLLFFLQNIQAQDFDIKIDTVWIPAADFVSPTSGFEMIRSAKCRDWYFCCFQQKEWHTFNPITKNHLFAISLDGKVVKEVPMPQSFDGSDYFDFFTRDNVLYAKDYWAENHSNYSFDYDKWTWKHVRDIPDIIYEDNDCQIINKELGEWGTYGWVLDYHTSNYYLHPGLPTRIVKHNGCYYFLSRGCLSCKDDLTKGILCDWDLLPTNRRALSNIRNRSYTYAAPKKFFCFVEKESWSPETWGPTYDTIFKNIWSTGDRLYLWMKTGKKNFISMLEDDLPVKVMDVPEIGTIFCWHNSYRGENQGDNQFQMQFRGGFHEYGLIDVVDTTISIRYLKYDLDTLHYLGEDNVLPLIKFLLEHIENLNIDNIDSLEKQLGGTASTLEPQYDLMRAYDPSILKDKNHLERYYFKLVDTNRMVATRYSYHANNSLVDEFKMYFPESEYATAETHHPYNWLDIDSALREQLEILIKQITGAEPTKNGTDSKWTLGDHTLVLSKNHIRWVKE